ncbi:MAG: sulfatase-like hydrolase/transferase [Phycisphaerae bacterium]
MLGSLRIASITLGVLATCAGCERGSTTAKTLSETLRGAAAGCNVILISMDTTRADRLGCYGWSQAITPALDELARRGVRFDRAFAQVPITLPSHVNLLTGTYPPENGVRVNGQQKLGPELATLPELFERKGYQTAAFLGAAVLGARYGLNRGFSVYDDQIVTAEDDRRVERPAGEVGERALDWLTANATRPFMCLIHFYDPHDPYAAPEEFAQRTDNPYDAEITYMDAQIAKIVAWLDEHALRNKTLVMAVGDHGESLGDHGYLYHSLLIYNSIVQVPLLFSLPGKLPEGTRVSDAVRMVDIMPTVLELMGWDVPPEVSGESFAATLAGGAMPPRLVYAETDYPFDGFGWSKLRCLIDGEWKYIRAPEPELYDLSADPYELRNLASARPEYVEKMAAALVALEAKMVQREAGELVLSASERRALRRLGYVIDAGPAHVEPKNLKNPREMVAVAHKVESLVSAAWNVDGLLAQREPELALQAIEILEPLVQESPDSFVLVKLLGEAYAGAAMLEDAQRTLTKALELHPESVPTCEFLARVLRSRGALGQAVAVCQKAIAIDPEYAEAKALLPELNEALKAQQARIAGLREKRKSTPASAELSAALGNLLIRSGNLREGMRVLKDGLAHNPEDPALANALAWYLASAPQDELRDGTEAVRLARIACRGVYESNPSALDTLAAALAESGKFDEAVQTAQRAVRLARTAGDELLAALIARRLEHYEARRPIRWLP